MAAGEAILLSVGKSKSGTISAATDAATMVVTVDGGGTPAHPFVVGDYIATSANGDAAFTSDFVSAAGGGKKVTAVTNTTITGDGVNISADDITAGKAAYLVCRVNYLRPAAAASWNDIQGLVDFASQLGGNDE